MQLADMAVSKTVSCEFESHLRHHVHVLEPVDKTVLKTVAARHGGSIPPVDTKIYEKTYMLDYETCSSIRTW
jgi:hypothetical protein